MSDRALAALLALALAGPAPAADREALLAWVEADPVVELEPGTVVGRDALASLDAVLPPAFVAHLDFEGVAIEIGPTTDLTPHAAYVEATRRFAGQASLGADGALSGYVAGQPFTAGDIAAADPAQAGLMAAWNNRHRWTHFGYRSEEFVMCYMTAGGDTASRPEDWGGSGHCERQMTMNFHRVYLRHVATLPESDYRLDLRDAERFLYKDMMRITDPFDVAGTAFMIERPLAFGEEDQVHSYLPGERRVRRLSARERADAFMGSEFTLDDLEAWSGKVADYDWRYLDKRPVLAVVNSKHPYSRFQGPLSDVADDRWEVRDAHAVIATPTWEDHPYGARIMFFDAQTFVVLLTAILDRDDRLWKLLYPIYDWPEVEGEREPGDSALRWRSSVAIDLANARSSVTRSLGTDLPTMSASQVRRMFSASNLTEGR